MLYNIYFDNENEIEKIIDDNSDLYLIKITYDKNGNYLTFSENKNEYIPTLEEQLNEITKEQGSKISILEAENADLLLDSAIKDSKISTLENDLADLTLEIAMMEVR